MEVWLFRLLVVAAIAFFARQMLVRYRLIARAPGGFDTSDLGARVATFVSEIVFQSRTIAARPVVGVAHLLVFWGFCAFGGYTLVEALRGLGLVDLTGTAAFHAYRLLLVPFSVGVLAGIVLLAIRRGVLQPPALGATVSKESLLIAVFIVVLMVTFLVDAAEAHAGRAVAGVPLERVNWWAHMLVILAFTVLIPDSKHLHLLLSRRRSTCARRSSARGRLVRERSRAGQWAPKEEEQVLDDLALRGAAFPGELPGARDRQGPGPPS